MKNKKAALAKPETPHKGRKIAILGTATTSVHDAPYNDDSWEIWNISGNFLHNKRITRWFEMHTLEVLQAAKTVPQYYDFLKQLGPKVTSGHHSPLWPEAKLYPIDSVMARFGDYFTSTCSYMIALALHEHACGDTITDIGIWGIDMAIEGEYRHQRPCVEYYLGMARGMDITLHVAPESPILRTAARYAYDYLKLSREVTERLMDAKKDTERLRIASLEAEKQYQYAAGVRDGIKNLAEYWSL